MGSSLTRAERAAWVGRLSGEEPASAEPPPWFESQVIRLDGHRGMLQLSNFGSMVADDPAAFEAALVRLPRGELMLFSTLQTPHTVVYDGAKAQEQDIVIIGAAGHGGQRLRSAAGVQLLSVGRIGFMSSLGASSAEHLGISETTGVVVPASALSGHRTVLERGADLFPDTPLTRAAGATLSRLLYESLRERDAAVSAASGSEALLLALVRSLFDQLRVDIGRDRTTELRDAAIALIERRHRDPGFGIDALAAELHVSRRQLFRLFAGTEETPAGRLLARRLTSAREELLAATMDDLSAVAARAGFADAAALRAQFSRHVGLSPSSYRAAAHARQRRLAEAMLLTDEQGPLPLGRETASASE